MDMPNVLVAEDNATNAMLIQTILQTIGCSVSCVGNGRDAVDAAALQAFDLILMDVQMPIMDGLTAIRHLRQAEAKAGGRMSRIFVVTTNDRPVDVRASFDAGADGHITKPLAPNILLDAVASLHAGQPKTVGLPRPARAWARHQPDSLGGRVVSSGAFGQVRLCPDHPRTPYALILPPASRTAPRP